MANKINIVITAEDKASKPIREVADEMDHAGGKAGSFSDKISGLGKQAAIAAAAVGTAGLAGAVIGLKQGFEFNSQVEQAQTKLMAFMKDGQKVAKTLDWVKREAAATQFSFTDMADAAANLTPVAKTSEVALEDLVRQAEILAAINPTEGLTGATFSLREALSGDWVSIVDRFNLPRKRINELKEQGVPAMEIISRTLNEMGIDYGLVSEQGKTVSARWDQMTDKLKMMAGQATKPIFDRVSLELDKMSAFDYEGLGNQMASGLSGFLAWSDEMVPKIQEVGRQVGEYLGPKFQELVTIFRDELWPVTERLWKEVFGPLAHVLGVTLVVAIGLVIDALKFVWQVTSDVVTFILDIPAAVGKAFDWIGEKVNWLKDHWAEALGFMVGFFATLPFKLVMLAAQAVGGIVGTISQIDWGAVWSGLWRSASHAWDNVKRFASDTFNAMMKINWGAVFANAGRGLGNSIIGYIEGAINGALSGLPGNPKVSIQRFALGTSYAKGGYAVVGEHGPEVVRMPQGARVEPAYRSRQGGSSSPSQVLNVTNNIYNQTDYNKMLSDIGFSLRLAS